MARLPSQNLSQARHQQENSIDHANYRPGNGTPVTFMNRFNNRIFIGIVAFVVLAIIIAISTMFAWDWFRVGPPDSGGLDITLSLIGAGSLGVLVTWGFTLWSTHLTQRQIDLTSQNSRYDRYQRGIEMLGSPELFVRVGGIYALRTLMKEDPEEFHIPAVELLCAFLRNPVDADMVTKGSRVRQDIQTALDVIVGRKENEVTFEKGQGFRLDLRSANFQYADLPGVDFSEANLEGAILSRTNMDGANLSKAILNEADLSFTNCRGSNFRNASLVRANLHHVSADNSDFSETRIDWVNCNEGSFYKTTFTKAHIQNCEFKGALLHQADLTWTILSFGNMLTQKQLDNAKAGPDAPPFIYADLVDAETGEPLNWRGELPYQPSREEMQIRHELAQSKSRGRTLNLVSVNRVNMKPPTKPQAGYF